MKKNNVRNNLENKVRSILLDDGHFLFRLKKKSTSSTWSYFDTVNTRGITLIALIITIILMLILAGVVLNLTIGKNGLFNTAKYAVQKNSEETAREKLELALADLQAHKYTNEAYNEKEYINNYLINEGMQVIDDIVTVDGWKFTIDRTVPRIGQSLGQEDIRITISTPYVGTSSVTTKVQYITNEEEIESYTYMLDGEEIITNESKEYTLEDYLEPETTHKVQVTAKYKNNLTVESNIVTIKTKARTYLFNNGDECTNITGGWKGFIYEYIEGDYSFGTEGGYFTKSNDNCLEFGKNGIGYGDGGYRTVNSINMKDYKKLCVNVKNFKCNFIPRSDFPEAFNGYVINAGSGYFDCFKEMQYRNDTDISSEIVRLSLNSREVNGNVLFFTRAGAWAPDGEGIASCKIDAIWLEK